MRKNKYLQWLLILSAFFISPLLRADDFFAVKEQIIAESRFKLGFFYLTPLLFLENVGYTSSIYTYEKKDRPDWTGDLGLGLRASAIAANRLILQVEDLPYYSYYLKTKNLRSWSNRFGTTAYSYFGPLNLKAGYARNDLYQRPQLEFSRPYHYIASEWSAETDIGRLSNLFLTAYFAINKLAYDQGTYADSSNLAASLNHRENTFGLKLNQKVFTSTIIYANYERNSYRFEAGPERDADAQTVALGIEFPEIGILRGSFQIGLKSFDPSNPLFKKTQRPNGRGNIRISLFERLNLDLFFELQTYFSYGSSHVFYDNQSFGGDVEVYLTRFLKCGTTYQDGRLKYFSFLDLELQRRDRLRQQRYYLAIPFIGGTSLGFAYNIYHLTSDALGLDYTRSFWGGFITYEF